MAETATTPAPGKSKKVGSAEAAGATKTPKEKKPPKPEFNFSDAKAVLPVIGADGKPTGETAVQKAVNENGKLLAPPLTLRDGETVIYEGWNPKKFKPLSRKDFASDVPFLRFQAHLYDGRIKDLESKRDKKIKQADHLEKFGDDKVRKKAARLQKMRETMATLAKELVDDGVEFSDEEMAQFMAGTATV